MDDIAIVPAHVSIIMDGNGRWAKQRGRERVFGHAEGVESVRACVEASVEMGVRYLSLFAFSEENWERPDSEVNTLMSLMMKAIHNEIDSLLKNGVRFRVLGNVDRLDSDLVQAISAAEEKTLLPMGKPPVLTLIVFLSYSGKWDILQAAKRIASDYAIGKADPADLGISGFEKYLVTDGIPDPDLLIRTSGEKRISNFMLWQCAYTELIFVDTLWPDFRKEGFRSALKEFSARDRRYGKVK